MLDCTPELAATLRDGRVPDSVASAFARARIGLDDSLGASASQQLAASLVALRAGGVDAVLLGAIVQRAAVLAPRLAGPGGIADWLAAVSEVALQARPCTLALLASSDELLCHGSPAELLSWTRLGLREAHAGNASSGGADAGLAYFELRSRESASRVVTVSDARVDLASNKARLAHLLRALFDLAPALLGVEQGLATRRPFISNLGVHIPEAGRALRGALAQRWYDAAALHAAAHLRYSTQRHERASLKPVQMALIGVLEDARVELLAIAELPGLRRLWLGFHFVEVAHGNSFVVLLLRLARGLLDPEHPDPHPWVAKGRRLFHAACDGGVAPGLLTPVALRELASLLGNDIGQMRLQFNYREYVVEPAYRDDNACLWLAGEDAQPQLQAVADELPPPPDDADDADDDADTADKDQDDATPYSRPTPVASGAATDTPPLARWQYPEWDRIVGDYRSAWSTVLESAPARGDPRALQRSIDTHTALLLRLDRALRAGGLRERVKLRAQLRGDELDIDAVVRSAIDRRSHQAPDQKVFQRLDRRERDVAALVLLDSSASTADVLAATGASVLDLAREAALLTTLTLRRAGDQCAVHAFNSNGRHEVRYERALDFGEALDAAAIARLAGMQSRLSTRMGAALRHASHQLATLPQRKRLLLVITDGAPHDIDIHDRRYLIEDTRRAVLEAGRLGLAVFCVTLDPAADAYVKTIFGATNYRVLDRIESLAQVLPAIVLRLTR